MRARSRKSHCARAGIEQRQPPAGLRAELLKRLVMAKQKRKRPVKKMDEMRKLNTKEAKGHLHYVCGKVGQDYQSVGITHGKQTKGVNNVPLKKNPNPHDKKQAYVRPQLTQEKAKSYGRKLDGLGLSAEDKTMVIELIERLRKGKEQ